MVYTVRFFSSKCSFCFIILTYLVPVLFTFYYIEGVLKFKKSNSGAKRLIMLNGLNWRVRQWNIYNKAPYEKTQRNIVWKGRLEKISGDCDVKYVLRRLVGLEVLETKPRGNQPNIRRIIDAISYLHRICKSFYKDQDFPSLPIIYFSHFSVRIFLRYSIETATVLLLPNFNSLWPA